MYICFCVFSTAFLTPGIICTFFLFQLENKKEAFSPQLQEFCLAHPIAVIRGLANVLKLGKEIKSESDVPANSSKTTAIIARQNRLFIDGWKKIDKK